MTTPPKNQIFTINPYQLIYRDNDEYHTLKQEVHNKPFLLFLIGIPANIGVLVILLDFFKKYIINLGIFWSIIFLLLYLLSNNASSFLLKFKIINIKQPIKNNRIKTYFGIFDWIVIAILSILACLLFYNYVYAKLSINSDEIVLLKTTLFILAMPYYGYRMIKIIKMLFN